MFRFFCASLPMMLSVGIATAIYYYFHSQKKPHENRPHARKKSSTAFIDSTVNDCCGICLEDIRPKDQDIVRLGCNHRFHWDCIDGILTGPCVQKSCPLCRRFINLDQMSTVHSR